MSNLNKVIICGTRTFNDFSILQRVMSRWVEVNGWPTEIVTGGAKGADYLGGIWASNREILLHQFLANWHRWGKQAGPKRNSEMVAIADGCIAFWNGISKGTKDTITKSRAKKIECWICYYDKKENCKWLSQ